MKLTHCVVSLVLLCLARHADSFTSGAPDFVCDTMMPSHDGAAAQISASPYNVTFTPPTFTAGGPPVTVTLSTSNPASDPTFKGFLLTAQYVDTSIDQNLRPGTFSNLPPSTKPACNSAGVTQTAANNQNSMSMQWTPPAVIRGDIHFRVTFVQAKTIFWVDMRSATLSMDTSAATVTSQTSGGSDNSGQTSTGGKVTTSSSASGNQGSTGATPAVTPDVAPAQRSNLTKDAECGRTKGCFSDCTATGCTFLMTWASGTSLDNVAITLSGVIGDATGRYVSLALSDDDFMANDSVTYCIDAPDGAYNAYNLPGTKRTDQLASPQDGLSNIVTGVSDGVLTCSFTRVIAADSSGQRFPLDLPYILFFAMGPGTADRVHRHETTPPISPQAASLLNFTVDMGGSGQVVTRPPTVTPSGNIRKDPDCGSTKGCYSDCSNDNCNFLVTWAEGTSADNIAITMSGVVGAETGRYVSVGLSDDDSMGGDSVTYCINAPDGVFNSYNPPGTKSNRLLADPKAGLADITTSFDDGVLTCSFTRLKAADSSGERFTLDKAYTLFYATGPGSAAGMGIHEELPPISSQAASLQDFSVDIGGSTDFLLVKIHGIIMMVAWMLSASIGLTCARFFKDVWKDSTWFGLKVWFQVHRATMVFAFCATIAAFIIIFVDVGGYSDIHGEGYKKAHPIIGIIVTALVIINPIMSIFRKPPGDKRRVIFNWAHWAVGASAHILAGITITFGLLLDKSGAPTYTLYIMAVYGGWHLLALALFEWLQYKARNPGRREAYELSDIAGGDASKPVSKNPSTLSKRILLCVHIAVLTGVTLAIIIAIIIGE